jgi:hypothetical protein
MHRGSGIDIDSFSNSSAEEVMITDEYSLLLPNLTVDCNQGTNINYNSYDDHGWLTHDANQSSL